MEEIIESTSSKQCYQLYLLHFQWNVPKDVKIGLFQLKMPFLFKLEPVRIDTKLATLQTRPATTIFYRTLSSHTFSTSQRINRVISILIVLKRIVLSYTLHFSYLLKHTVYWKQRGAREKLLPLVDCWSRFQEVNNRITYSEGNLYMCEIGFAYF